MGKFKKSGFLMVLSLVFSLVLLTLNPNKVNAETVLDYSPAQYESHLNGFIKTTDFYNEFNTIIESSFPSLDVLATDYEQNVTGVSQFKILEITPRSISGDAETKVSDLSQKVTQIGQLFTRAISNNSVDGKHFIQNLPAFDVEVMTIKEFNSNREDIKGQYDAIVFSAGTYSTSQVDGCQVENISTPKAPNDQLKGGTYTTLKYPNNKTKYVGTILNGEYHGYGRLFNDQGQLLYEGDWNNGLHHNWGRLFNDQGILIYEGGFNNGLYHGWGSEKTDTGRLIYEGSYDFGVYHGEWGTLYDSTGKRVYAGGWNQGLYHKQGSVYYSNGATQYNGGFNNGKRSCHGNEYDSNYILRYTGKWANNARNGYGTSFSSTGRYEYEGYWSNNAQVADLNAQDLLNDITELKANEVISDYIDAGLPVFLHQDTMTDTNSALYRNFNQLVSSENVFMLDYEVTKTTDNIGFFNAMAIMGVTELFSSKPYVDMIAQPVDYYDNPNNSYAVNDQVNFSFNLTNKDSAIMFFSIDINQNNVFEEDEIAYSQSLNRGSNSFSFEVPQVYNGLLNYQISVTADGMDTNVSGTFKVNGPVEDIRVLNIVSEYVITRNSLFDLTLMNNYFENNGDYNISVDSCDIKAFKKNNSKKDCSHASVMDGYDVIILGQDIFDNSMTKHVYNSLQAQINLGKPVIFTSSFTKGHTKWIEYFGDELALMETRTDLYTLNSVDHLQIMNQYSYNTYPYNLNNEDLTIPRELNFSFNEQFRINLENGQLVPLLNMYQETPYNLDRFDSYNNYYYLKNDNVLYLNVGTNAFLPYTELEHKLITNAVINSYIESKAKDNTLGDFTFVSVDNDFEDSIIDISDDVFFDFSVFRSNLDEEDVFTYSLYVDNITVESNTPIIANELYNIHLSDLASPNINGVTKVYIQLVVEDQNGVRETYAFNVYVANYKNYVSLSKQVNAVTNNGIKHLEINHWYNMQYTLTMNNLDFSHIDSTELPSTLTLRNLEFTDFVPNGIYANSNLFTMTPGVDGTNITRQIPDVTYQLNAENVYVAVNNVVNFTLPIAATNTGTYDFNQSRLSFDGVGTDTETLPFNNVVTKAVKGLTSDLVNLNFAGHLFVPLNTMPIYMKDYVSINYSDTAITSVAYNGLESDTYNPTLRGEKEYAILVTDLFGNTVLKTFTLLTYEPVHDIRLGQLDVKNGYTETLPLELLPSKVTLEDIRIEVLQESMNPVVSYEIVNDEVKVTGLRSGFATIRVTGYDLNGNLVVEEGIINVYSNLSFVDQHSTFVKYVGSEPMAYPELRIDGGSEFTVSDIRYSSNNNGAATVDPTTGLITVVGPGTAIIEAYLVDLLGNKTEHAVAINLKITDRLDTESGFSTDIVDGIIPLYTEHQYNLEDFIVLYPADTLPENITMTFEIEGVESSAIIDNHYTFTEIGNYTVTVTITQSVEGEADIIVVKTATLLVINPIPDDRH